MYQQRRCAVHANARNAFYNSSRYVTRGLAEICTRSLRPSYTKRLPHHILTVRQQNTPPMTCYHIMYDWTAQAASEQLLLTHSSNRLTKP
jgi:hypothetical protein